MKRKKPAKKAAHHQPHKQHQPHKPHKRQPPKKAAAAKHPTHQKHKQQTVGHVQLGGRDRRKPGRTPK
jgi:hypothetical protein